MEIFNIELINVAVTVVVALAGLVTKQAMSYLKKKGVLKQLESHKVIVDIAVNAVEQMYKKNHGEEKLNLAKMEIIKLAKAKKIKISEKELDLMIESAVKEMNKTIKEEMKK
ncbi:phage holin [Priestia aryabhattai]|uniref:phage holin n=1 Tax=Priestia aryabhattai TaxID=412384 RepID=UPI0039A3E78F